MPLETDIILTIAGGLVAALAGGLITQRLGLSPIVGYLLAGVAGSLWPLTAHFLGELGATKETNRPRA